MLIGSKASLSLHFTVALVICLLEYPFLFDWQQEIYSYFTPHSHFTLPLLLFYVIIVCPYATYKCYRIVFLCRYYKLVIIIPIFQYSNVYMVTADIQKLYRSKDLQNRCMQAVKLPFCKLIQHVVKTN